jgi:hypothetical protein
MIENPVLVGDSRLQQTTTVPRGSHVDIDGERFYRITGYDAMPPFLMSIVSDSDHWLFISSTGGLTAGRRDPDHALFPYDTDDRIHDSHDHTGSKTVLFVERGQKRFLWEPFSQRYAGVYRVSRTLSKSIFSNKIIFEEENHDLSLTFSYAWLMSERFGFVRRATLVNHGKKDVAVELLDGIQNVLPYGVTRRFQMEYSTLVDGYKQSELDPATGLALLRLSSIPIDRAEPSEALRTTTAWSEGLDSATRLLSSSQLDRFRRGDPVVQETNIRGRRGAYLLNTRLVIPAAGRKEWHIVAEVGQDAAQVASTLQLLKSKQYLRAQLHEDVNRGTRNLVRIVATADGLQLTQDELSTWRHFSNALFNVMRGGVPDRGYQISRSDLRPFLAKANRDVAQRHTAFLDGLPETLLHRQLLDSAREQKDPDLERLTHEYLPFTFSRRHGDPSRPWNFFVIDVKDEHGEKTLNYQGNWRDIFQNWEALALSFPGYIESMIFKFLDASTADGYNPYRITRNGFDWEVIDPHDAWSYIGYWNDHQVIYLLKLLEESAHYHPDALPKYLTRTVFTYANVPYRIKPYDSLLRNPRRTIDFDAALDREIQERVATMGADAKALLNAGGALCHANLTEKLLVTLLAKLSNYIPEAGIWINTQRPEWNDANNALVGNGVSMVTLYYLRRFLAFCHDLFQAADASAIEVSSEVAEMFRRVLDALQQHVHLLGGSISNRDRKVILDALGKAGSDYRTKLYAQGLSGSLTPVAIEDVRAFCKLALQHIDHSIRANRRDDGLYHSYNLMKLVCGQEIEISRLHEMLEGQVAVLSSGALSAHESAALLDTLRQSKLYRADQNSYILYPDRQLPGFKEKNNVSKDALGKSRLLTEMTRRGDRRLLVVDLNGTAHFNAAFRNSEMLRAALTALKDSEYHDLVEKEETLVLDLYEQVFDHRSFTGRSGSFFKYEGLGSIYWHMVSKLLVAVQETLQRAFAANEDEAVIDRLSRHYDDIREGLGVHKQPATYGAIPTDPYSHTPGFIGVQQPGMTGQVKEDLITRLGEMGVKVENGRIRFCDRLFRNTEFLKGPATFHCYDVAGQLQSVGLTKDSVAFTTCQVPVIVHRSGRKRIEVTRAGRPLTVFEGLNLDAETSAAIFQRTGEIQRLNVFLEI